MKANVIWKPIPGTSQELALDTRCHHTLYYGTRGPGKTSTQLMAYRRYVGKGYGAFWRGIIFDREYKNLSDLITQSKKFFHAFQDGARFLSSPSELRWVWPTGEELLFRYVKRKDDYDSFHGHEYPFIGWNELTKWPTSHLYDMMMSTNRSSFVPSLHSPRGKVLPPLPLMCFSTTNPNGAGHNWVRRRFIDPAKPGTVVTTETEVFDPQTKENRTVAKTQVAIFGSYRENIYLPAEYIAELNRLTANDENLRRAWLYGDWDIVSGGALDDVWRSSIHVLPRFQVPKSWRVDRAMDWGSSHPFSVGWWAEASGEEARLPDGSTFCPPAGTLVQVYEWYGAKNIGENRGLKLSAKDVAVGIAQREAALIEGGWIKAQPLPGAADNQIRDVRESDVETIEKKMADHGIRWESSDKSAGSRRNGLQLIRDRLQAAKDKEGAALYFMDCCRASIETIPGLPRDDKNMDDIDTTAEDHAYDMVRYRVLRSANRYAQNVSFNFPT